MSQCVNSQGVSEGQRKMVQEQAGRWSFTGVARVFEVVESLHLSFLIVPFCFSCVAAIVHISSFIIFTGTNFSCTDIQRF